VTTTFPITQKERVGVGNLDLYAMDTYKFSQRWTVIAGLRAT
jgi:outer membrane receptor protein involved in Fe transport